MLGWWKRWRDRTAETKASLAISDNIEFRASQVPELIGMEDVEAMAYILKQIEEWNSICTSSQSAEYASRLKASGDAWNEQGLTMPYWGNLWVLRTYQSELGLSVPPVSQAQT
ncbi:MAG: hypothetical protein ACT6Q3_10015 [Sphingopyxis sp.]